MSCRFTNVFSTSDSIRILAVVLFFSLVFSSSVYALQGADVEVLYTKEHGIVPNTKQDSTRAVVELIEKAVRSGNKKIVFAPGTYHFYPEMAHEAYTFISNNDEGLKRVVFPLFGANNIEIDGQGADFVFHGGINPFILQDSANITLRNFSIDFYRAFHSEGKILAVGDGYMDLHIPEIFPFRINAAGILEFLAADDIRPSKIEKNIKLERRLTTKKAEEYAFKRMLEYDPETRATPYMAGDLHSGHWLSAKKLEGHRNIRIFHPVLKGTVGNIMTFSSKYRRFPGFVVSDSSEVLLDNITIYHAGGMGVLGQRCHNFTMQNSKVTPSEGRIISATADATHFNNCTGKVALINNLFENQQDDATNIHGIYAMFYELLDEHTAYIKTMHPQQWGFDFIDVGDEMELVHGKSLRTYGTNTIQSVTRINKEINLVRFDKPIDSRIKPGDSISEIRDYPFVHIKGNTIRRNRARGMLLNCRGKTIVEDNYFHVPGAALLFEGDAVNWYEQGGVTDVTIRNNVFDNSLFSVWGKAIIDVDAGIEKAFQAEVRYNKNILIENNTFNVFDERLILDIFSVENLRFTNNTINKTTAFPERELTTEPFFRVKHSDNVIIADDNKFVGFD
ncbi:right-handed parallel beta-helix repeat-containing protein [Agaribacter flavus]|uniref:Right-handed parallel beta-helix repeat-containing protein n=1 Tax=Agaribacter flavus TaxID=1902781 RepID=A0ABV7FKY4_9ALTE